MPQVIFDCVNAVQNWTVPAQVTSVTIECYGANSYPNQGAHRFGGYAKGDLAVTPGEVLRIYVGGEGTSFRSGGASSGGYNGGGDSGNGQGAGGGGATDVRQGGTALSNRKIVAGGAGGWGTNGAGASSGTNDPGLGGAATGETGTNASSSFAGGGGTQSAGGSGGGGGPTGLGQIGVGGNPGTLGFGGTGGSSSGAYGGGGGGGYYGGGGGGANSADNAGSGGGGGSNYVGGSGLTNTTTTRGVSHSYGINDGRVIITYNAPPNAPTPTTPATNSAINQAQALTLGWNYSDPDAGDNQSRADYQWRVGNGAWTVVNNAATTAQTATAAANTWSAYTGQKVEWQVRTYDTGGKVSSWSASSYFTPTAQPDAPTLTSAPTSITSNTPSLSFKRTAGGPFSGYEIRIMNDVGGVAGSTQLADTVVTYQSGVTKTTETTQAPNYVYVNGTSYHIQVRVQYPAGIWSNWTDTGALAANVNTPKQPTLAIVTYPDTFSSVITITNPGSDPHPPVFNNLYRTDSSTGVEELIQSNLGLNATYTDWTIGLNRQYGYRVEAVTSAGAITSST